FAYWRAALQTAKAHPCVGTGPGTFAIPYAQIKRPEAEMSRMVHNDYLEQASDSGLVGFLSYTLFLSLALILSYPNPNLNRSDAVPSPLQNFLPFSVCLGLFGWALQGSVEFGLYVPPLSCPAF